ncbi:S24 family peptidase [Pantoea stewartii]
MGFPSPAQDFVEDRPSLDMLCNTNAASVYLFKTETESALAGIKKGALLVCNSANKPLDGSIIAANIGGQFKLVRYRTVPRLHLEELNNPDRKISLTAEEVGDSDEGFCSGNHAHR